MNTNTIHKKFYRQEFSRPSAYTVGELLEILKQLPPELEIESDFSSGVELVVYNMKTNRHLQFREIEE